MIFIIFTLNILFFILFNILKPLKFGKLFKCDLVLFRMKYNDIDKCYTLQTKLGLFWFTIYYKDAFTKYGLIYSDFIHALEQKRHFNTQYFYDYAYHTRILHERNQLYNTEVFQIREYFNKQFNITE